MTGTAAWLLSQGYTDEKIAQIPKAFVPQGSIAFENLPATPTADKLGYIWNITNDFTTDSRFIEGAGKKHAAGNNVAIVKHNDSYMYDVMSAIDLSNYYTKTETDTKLAEKLNVLPKVDDPSDPGFGWEYHIPYNFEATPDAEKLNISLKTLTLDNKVTKMNFDKTLPGATTTAAGLMTAADKVALNGKQDQLTAGYNINITDNIIKVVPEYITLTGTSGTLTDEQATKIQNNELVFISLNGKRFEFRKVVVGRGTLIVTFGSVISTDSDIIEVSVLEKIWTYKTVALQEKLTAGNSITINDNVISAINTLPQDANASDIVIFNGTDWQKQSGYGYDADNPVAYSWDGDTTGKETLNTDVGLMCNIANPSVLPTESEVENHKCVYSKSGISTTIYWDDDHPLYMMGQNALFGQCSDNLFIVVIYQDNTYISFFNATFNKGIWFNKNNNGDYVVSIEKASLTTTQIDSKFIPKDSTKQDKLTAGTNIQITNNTISATDTKYTVTLDL